MAQSVVIAGAVAQKPGNGGHTWVFLQYLLGFRELGWSVLFLDRLEPEMCVDEDGRPSVVEKSFNLSYLDRVFRELGLGDRYAVFQADGQTIGVDRERVLREVAEAALLLNVNGFLDDEEVLSAAP